VVGGLLSGVAAALVILFIRFAVILGVLVVSLYETRSWQSYFARVSRRELWLALKVSAYPLVGDRVYQPGFDAPVVALGIGILFGSCMIIGVAFAAFAHGRSRLVTYLLGILFGIGTWILGLLLVNPSPATALYAIPSGVAMATVLLSYERRLLSRG
jgi:hypothetical protein